MATKTPKVVFDTNIFISAILFGGNPREVLEHAREKNIQLITSPQLLLELANKLHKKFEWKEVDIAEVIEGIGSFAQVVRPKRKVDKIKGDESDNRVFECAKEAKASFIVSGDKRHILPLKKFGKTRIVSATEFLKIIEKS